MLLCLDALPPRTNRQTVVRLLEQVGGLERQRVGAVEIRGRSATVEVPDACADRLAQRLDGANLANQHIRAWVRRSSPGVAAGAEDHFARLLRLLEIEGRAEAEQSLQRRRKLSHAEAERSGLSLVGLVLRDRDAGLGGRWLGRFGKPDFSQPLPWTRLSIGAPVLLSSQGEADGSGWRGVVCDRDFNTLQVALEQIPEFDADGRFRLDLAGDETARQRQRLALERASSARGDRLAELREVLLGAEPAEFAPPEELEFLNPGLNASQREAVQFALSARDCAIIHGPPGTGKTTTVVELIRQAIRRGEKVLACGPSNLAVDNMFERLLARGEAAVRLGHPARILPGLREHSLDMLVEHHPDVRLARKLVKEADALFARASKYKRARPAPGEKKGYRDEARQLLADARRLEAQAVQETLDRATVICATTTGLDSELLGQRRFGLAVVDEACQSTEPGVWIPLLRCERLVLAGDHRQLPPTVLSQEAARDGLGISLLERLMGLNGRQLSRQLLVQYRMHDAIMQFSSREFYDGTLIADPQVEAHLLQDLEGVAAGPSTATPLEYIDTAGAGFDEELEPDGESRLNRQEADWVVQRARQLLEAGVPPAEIAVISPYAAQVRLIREKLVVPGLEIDTVDGFQGREKEAVLISLVRANAEGEIGFLADTRRMNVALTRARRKLILIGDSATIGSDPFYQRLLQYLEEIGAYHTVWESWE